MPKPITRWDPINFEGFVRTLKNYDLFVKERVGLEMRRRQLPTQGLVPSHKTSYMKTEYPKLLIVFFASEDDTTASIEVITKRVFNQFSAVVNNQKKT